ncbi:major facilitator superfamily domain-containing protein [Xylaria venustula]|nr:major facilitator superfamily domain-containing protein [Xylaria venustula]
MLHTKPFAQDGEQREANGQLTFDQASMENESAGEHKESTGSVDSLRKDRGNGDAEKGGVLAAPKDPDIVDWDGPDDPANPRNWSKARKLTNVVLVALSVLYVMLATTLFAPAAPSLEREFKFNNSTVEVLTITIASLGFALGQLFIPPLSEVFGRQPVYRASAIAYIGWTVGCSRCTNVAEFLVFRFFTGISASSYLSTGGGTIADLLVKEERGLAMALFTSGPIFGPVIGPIIGGVLTENLGWRWCFYLVLILAVVVTAISFFVMTETDHVTLLKAKAARLRKETGNPKLRAAGDRQIPISKLLAHALARPITFQFTSPIVFLLSLYIAFNFGVTMLLFATFPTVFEEAYNFSVSVSGLAYIGVGVGCAVGIFVFAKFSDRIARDKDGVYRSERRMILMIFASPLFPIALFIYGWTVKYQVHWIVPIIGTAIGGPGAVLVNAASQSYIVDIFGPQAGASALAAVTLLRNLAGAFLPLAAPRLYANLGLGWGNSVLGFITTAFIPVPFLFYWKGQALRERFPVKI